MTKRFQVSWLDDFHMNYALMVSEGAATARGSVVPGTCDITPHDPRWGWDTVCDLIDDNLSTITAYNVTPDGEDANSVETRYVRKKE